MRRDFAVFVDRDGTINLEIDFLSSPTQLELIPRSAEAIHILNAMNIPVFVITNQSGIARGYLTVDDLINIHNAMTDMLSLQHATITEYFYCPHHPSEGISAYVKDCDCRKPNPGMLLEASRRYGIDLKKSFVVGDKCIDMQTAKNVGATAIQVSTGYGSKEKDYCEHQRDHFSENLYDAVQTIRNLIQERESVRQ